MVRRDFLFLACQVGHDWRSSGGCSCGCRDAHCSVPVNQCSRCGDYDYGENEEARAIRVACDERREINT